jgi:DNA-directed RNA polymerase specialized sigma subunit
MSVLDAFDLAGCDDAELGRPAAAGDAPARRELIERYLPLARMLALRDHWSGEPRDDPRARDVLRMRFQHDLRQGEITAAIGCSQMQVSRIIRTSLERLSAHASMACGGWSMSGTTEGATA